MPLKTQKISTGDKTEVVVAVDDFSSIMFTNTHATAAVTIDLWIVDQSGSSVTITDVYVNTSYVGSVPGTTIAVTVDNGSGGASDASNDEFLNEKVYNSSGDLHGTCTTVTSTTRLDFSDGLYKSLSNNDRLYVGTRFYIFNNVIIPNGATLQLLSSDINFNNNDYNMYIDSDNASGLIDIITSL